MTVVTSVITIDIDPTIEIGPITVAWHGLTIVIGILVGGLAAASARSNRSEAQSRSSPPLPPSPVPEQDPLPVGLVIDEILKAQRPVGELDEVAILGTHADGPTATEDKSRGPIPVEGDDLVTT